MSKAMLGLGRILTVVLLHTGITACGANVTTDSATNITQQAESPNILFFFVDDLHYNAIGHQNPLAHTPNIDKLAANSMIFNNAHAVLAICSPSRATVLTGRYPSSHGVTTFGNTPINTNNPSFVHALKAAGYATAVVGKWHLGNEPHTLGFDSADIFHANGRWYGRKVNSNGENSRYDGFIETWSADKTIAQIDHAATTNKPFFIWHNTQVPHMTSEFTWPATDSALAQYHGDTFPLPESYPPDHNKTGKPPYLAHSRSFTKAMEEYGYSDPDNLQQHMRDYQASVTDMDKELGRIMAHIDELGFANNTYIVFMSDNGWMLGEHGLTSKVLPYDRSAKVPLFIAGPGITPQTNTHFVNNADMAPTLLALAKASSSGYAFHGKAFAPMLFGESVSSWEDILFYESPTPQLVPRPFYAVKDEHFIYIETMKKDAIDTIEFVELYDVVNDPNELVNLALDPANQTLVDSYQHKLRQQKRQIHDPDN